MARAGVTYARLSRDDTRKIVILLETWEGPLTWQSLVERAAKMLGRSYSRQALEAHADIKAAYLARKQRNRVIRDSVRARKAQGEVPSEIALLLQRAEAAELRAQALETQLNQYRCQFLVWLTNARDAGITEERLNQPLQPVDQVAGAPTARKRRRERRL